MKDQMESLLLKLPSNKLRLKPKGCKQAVVTGQKEEVQKCYLPPGLIPRTAHVA